MEQTASWLQRVGALVVDWIASSLVVMLFIGVGGWSDNQYSGLFVLAVFVLESAFFTALLGGSFGKLALRLRVVRHDGSGRPVSLLMALLRSVLVALVIPPLVFRPDGRGLHDMVAGTSTVLLRDVVGRVGQRS